ncbi:hypothetical protein EDC94DRAFT_621933 [Helicostylum pulchrum]|nr:hypothetical protein EDC94DRAFT_621933 [Helicostylum pulchrum]
MVNTLIYESGPRPFGYATIAIYLAVIVDIIYLFRKRTWCRSYTGYTAIAAALVSMLNISPTSVYSFLHLLDFNVCLNKKRARLENFWRTEVMVGL